MHLYHIASALKLVLGSIVLIATYTNINIYEDPIAGIALAFWGIFIASWGASFYLFLGIHKLNNSNKKDPLYIHKDSYKLSLLFGIYVIINFLLIVLGRRNKFVGITFLTIFITIYINLFGKSEKNE